MNPNSHRARTNSRGPVRLTIVACVTGIIDRYAPHADQLGPRWLYVRIPERPVEAKRKAAHLARRSGLTEHRKRAREAVSALLSGLPDKLPELSDATWDAIEDAALVTAWGRGAVPRNGYGRREIEGIPVVEEPMRLVQQLGISPEESSHSAWEKKPPPTLLAVSPSTPCQKHGEPSYKHSPQEKCSAHPHAQGQPDCTVT